MTRSDIRIGIFALVILISIIIVVTRLILSAIKKRGAANDLNAIKNDPAKAAEYAVSLDIPYNTKQNFSSEAFTALQTFSGSTQFIGDFRILYAGAFDLNQILVFTEISYVDFDINVVGGSSDTRKKAYHSFVLRFDPVNNALSSWSTLYSDVTEKLQKESFLNELLKGK